MPADSAAPDQHRVRVEGLHKHFGKLVAVADVNLAVKVGEVMVIIGPSGSGKSTVLRCMNHLEVPTKGAVYLDGIHLEDPKIDINKVRRNMGMVFQQFNLFPHLTVMGNLTLAQRKVLGRDRSEAEEIAMQQLRRVGIPEKANMKPAQLSGGQQQRVAIARSLSMNPKVMLFDEPTSALDPEMINEVLDVMRELAASGMTMIVVTHEMGFAREVGSHLVMMDEGRVVEEGSAAEVFANPQSKRTREFFSKIL
jgi:ABC-type polar amino acid transport system ATPase subunit